MLSIQNNNFVKTKHFTLHLRQFRFKVQGQMFKINSSIKKNNKKNSFNFQKLISLLINY
jgi:hypothetical protein